MALTEKKKASNAKYFNAKWSQVKLTMPNAEAEALTAYCVEKGLAKAGFIRALVKGAIAKGITTIDTTPSDQAQEPPKQLHGTPNSDDNTITLKFIGTDIAQPHITGSDVYQDIVTGKFYYINHAERFAAGSIDGKDDREEDDLPF